MRKAPTYDLEWLESHAPFKKTLEKMVSPGIDNTDYECLNSTDCFANNIAGNVFETNMMTQENTIKLSHDDIMAAVERTKKYIKDK